MRFYRRAATVVCDRLSCDVDGISEITRCLSTCGVDSFDSHLFQSLSLEPFVGFLIAFYFDSSDLPAVDQLNELALLDPEDTPDLFLQLIVSHAFDHQGLSLFHTSSRNQFKLNSLFLLLLFSNGYNCFLFLHDVEDESFFGVVGSEF